MMSLADEAAVNAGWKLRLRATVLLAEDDPGVARALVRVLRSHFDIVGIVADGDSLIRKAHELLPDLILSDVGLEGMDGISATVQILQRHPSVVIVLLTGDPDPSLRSRALAAGASAVLSKSEELLALVAVLHSLLQ